MSPSLPPLAEVAARLRAAGCVFAEDEARLILAEAPTRQAVDALVGRRVDGEPLEYVLGWAEFRGLRIRVAPGLFVPRRRTELLARETIRAARPGGIVLDLCCGTGAVAAAVAAALPGVEVHATDVDPAATACARENLGTSGSVHTGDLFSAVPPALRGRIDVVAANAPYVPTDAIALMPPEAREHESRVALDGGGDGLDLHRRIAADAPAWLAPGGRLLIETSVRQAPATAGLMTAAGLRARTVRSEDLDGTVVIGRLARQS